jgi:hypothetical protein
VVFSFHPVFKIIFSHYVLPQDLPSEHPILENGLSHILNITRGEGAGQPKGIAILNRPPVANQPGAEKRRLTERRTTPGRPCGLLCSPPLRVTKSSFICASDI